MVAPALAFLAVVWLVLLLATPLFPASLSALMYAAASLICHQRPERSFHLDAVQLPVCARCLGIYAGAAAGCVTAILAGRKARRSDGPLARGEGSIRIRVVTVLALTPTMISVALEWAGLWYPTNVTRALAGAPAGYVVALVVTRALATVHYGEWALPRPTAPNPPRSHT